MLAYDTLLVGALTAASGRSAQKFAGATDRVWLFMASLDFRFFGDTTGTITNNNRVMVKAGPTDPETPMAGARVRLHRKQDGYCAWEGISDAAGYYHASGLEVGLTYIPVAIDMSGNFECVAAGPVVAVKADA